MATALVSTGVQFPDSTIQTVAATGSGTVTSVATSSGITGGTITTTGTISLVTTTGAVGTYGLFINGYGAVNPGGTIAGSSMWWVGMVINSYYNGYNCTSFYTTTPYYAGGGSGQPSGTWRAMGYLQSGAGVSLCQRIA